MFDELFDLFSLNTALVAFSTEENTKRVQLHLRLLKQLLLKYSVLRSETKDILENIPLLLVDEHWLKLEVVANQLSKNDDVIFRRYLFHFAKCMKASVIRPSVITVFDTDIDLLPWYRTNYALGYEPMLSKRYSA